MTEPITPCTCITAHDRAVCVGLCCDVLTPHESLLRQIAIDGRNVRDLRRGAYSKDVHARVIADCAKRLLDARALGRDLERQAEANLRNALDGWRT